VKVLKDVQLRTCLSRARHRLGNTLERIATLLCRRQLQWLRNIRVNSPETGSDLRKFSRTVPEPAAKIIQARRPRQITFYDLSERKVRNGFVSCVAAPDGASETLDSLALAGVWGFKIEIPGQN
jgi:hypothetical protein